MLDTFRSLRGLPVLPEQSEEPRLSKLQNLLSFSPCQHPLAVQLKQGSNLLVSEPFVKLIYLLLLCWCRRSLPQTVHF